MGIEDDDSEEVEGSYDWVAEAEVAVPVEPSVADEAASDVAGLASSLCTMSTPTTARP